MIRRALLASALLLSGCGGREPARRADRVEPAAATASPGYAPAALAGGGGSVTGIVTLTGPVPKLQPRAVTQDHVACGRGDKPAQSLVLGAAGGIGGAVVRLVGIRSGVPFTPVEPVLDQKGCDYVPHMQIVPMNVPVAFINSDPVNHNVHAYGAGNASLFNVGEPVQGQRVDRAFAAPGPVRVKCDVHPWMSAWIWVADTPYAAVTGADGRFSMTGVPPGTWRLAVWHELLGEKEQPVTVVAGQPTATSVALSLLDAAR